MEDNPSCGHFKAKLLSEQVHHAASDGTLTQRNTHERTTRAIDGKKNLAERCFTTSTLLWKDDRAGDHPLEEDRRTMKQLMQMYRGRL